MEAAVTDILSRIDNAIASLCPCGVAPRPGSPYCSADCEPTHIAQHTDTRMSGDLATAMRWRPDLVAVADDADLLPIGSQTCGYTGRFNAQVYERTSAPETWHLRLDDGHRFVGLDLDNVGGRDEPVSLELAARIGDAWQRLERELTNPEHGMPGHALLGGFLQRMHARLDAVVLPGMAWQPTEDPWADVMPSTIDPEHIRQAVAASWHSLERVRAAAAAMVPMFAAAQEAMRRAPALDEALDDRPPTDPMARALWLRQHRNTGPAAHRLDGRRRRQ
jgi:hypothetical protein